MVQRVGFRAIQGLTVRLKKVQACRGDGRERMSSSFGQKTLANDWEYRLLSAGLRIQA